MLRVIVLVLASLVALPAAAKSARCFTTDEGEYPCDFVSTDGAGSFRLEADGFPTVTLEVTEPGVADGYTELGGRSVFLPGRFLRAKSDPACWVNDETGVKVCAW